jgi:hypothetical protein
VFIKSHSKTGHGNWVESKNAIVCVPPKHPLSFYPRLPCHYCTFTFSPMPSIVQLSVTSFGVVVGTEWSHFTYPLRSSFQLGSLFTPSQTAKSSLQTFTHPPSSRVASLHLPFKLRIVHVVSGVTSTGTSLTGRR